MNFWVVLGLVVVAVVLVIFAVVQWAIQSFMKHFPDRPIPFDGLGQDEVQKMVDAEGPGVFLKLKEKYGSFMRVGTVLGTCDPALSKKIMCASQHAAPRPAAYRLMANLLPAADGILFKAGEEWTKRRHVVMPVFQRGFLEQHARTAHESAVEVAEYYLAKRWKRGYVPEELMANELSLGADRKSHEDLLTFTRSIALRFLARWGFGVCVESWHVGATGDGVDNRVEKEVDVAGIGLGRRLVRSMDEYARELFDDMQGNKDNLGKVLINYVGLWRKVWSMRQDVETMVNKGLYCGASGLHSGEMSPVVPNLVSLLLSVGFSGADLVSELNHVHGAHKAAALASTFILWELSQPKNAKWRKIVQEEIQSCLAKKSTTSISSGAAPASKSTPASKSNHSELFARARGAEAEKRRSEDVTLALSDLKELPKTSRVIWESQRRHVVSFAVARRLGEEERLEEHDVTLEEGTETQVWLHALHFDPELWGPSVDEFDPDRFLPPDASQPDDGGVAAVSKFRQRGHFFPFVEGKRRCAGEHVAWLQILANLNVLLRKYDLKTTSPLVKRGDMFVALKHPVAFEIADPSTKE